MKKTIFLILMLMFLIVIITLPLAYSQTFEFSKQAINDVVALELSIPVKYDLTIKNNNVQDDSFKVYSILRPYLKVVPITSFLIPAGQEKTISLTALPFGLLKKQGLYSFEYFIKGEKSGAITDSIFMEILPLENIISVKMPSSITRADSVLKFNITNKNINLGTVKFILDSDFSKAEQDITLNARSSHKIELELDQDKLKTARAGENILKLTFFINDYDGKVYEHITEKKILVEEFINIITTETTRIGILSFTEIITKKNEGNSPKLVTIETAKNKFEYSFSSFNIQPTYEKPSFNKVSIGWQREIEPGESFTIEIKTDYTIQVAILILAIIAAVIIYLKRRPHMIVKKKAIKIRTKGGEFALKIVLFIKNIGEEAKEVVCTEKLPIITKLYERFGAMKPDKIEKNKIVWKFGTLSPDESRVISYIIYSKVIPVGTIKIPKAVVSYIDAKEKKHVVYSNELAVLGEAEK